METNTTDTPRTDSIISAIDMDQAFQDLCRQLEIENENLRGTLKSFVLVSPIEAERIEKMEQDYARIRKLMRNYIDFMDENLGTTADWPMEAAFDDESTAQRHCDLLNAMKREVKPEDIN